MASPTYQQGTIGNVLNAVALAPGKNVAALVDLSTVVSGAIDATVETGATAPTAATTFALRRVKAARASLPNTTLSAAVLAGATTINVASAAGITLGQQIALIGATSKVGEVVTVSAISGTTLTLSAPTTYAYALGDLVFLTEQTASGGSIAPGSAWSANSPYGTSLTPYAAYIWILLATNTDGTATTTVTATLDTNPSIQ